MHKTMKNRRAILASLLQDPKAQIRAELTWRKYETGIHRSFRMMGPRQTLLHYKACYAFLRDTNLELSTNSIPFCKVDSLGIPKTLWPLRPLIRGDRNAKRLALTIARSYELIKLPIDYSTESIESPAPLRGLKWQETTKWFNLMLEGFSRKYPWYIGSLQKRDGYEPKVSTTQSSGPNGSAVACAHLDAKAVTKDKALYKHLSEFNEALGQQWITRWMNLQAESFESDETYYTGRLGFSAEPGGKTRVFAIADYWSQASLKVIQQSLNDTLKSISTDCTSDQQRGYKALLKESQGKPTYCFDLTSASDRIPAVMQKKRLELIGGKKLGETWLSLMTDRTFYIKTLDKSVSWKVGQPLGLQSSFPSFALWHHDIVQLSYNLERMKTGKPVKFFKDYKILGDDVVIYNEKVAGTYQYLITKVFHIDINLSKSVIGDSENSQIEFTKRLSLCGKEQSSISRNITTKNDLQSMLDLVELLTDRDFVPQDTSHYALHPLLESEEETQFKFMLWSRSRCDAPFRVNTTLEISRDAYTTKVRELRLQNIQLQTTLLDEFLNSVLPMDTHFKESSIPYSERALGLGRHESDGFVLHPIVWAVNQTGLDLSEALGKIWDEESPDVSPVEYLPMVNSKSYHVATRKGNSVFTSKIIMDAYKDLTNQAK